MVAAMAVARATAAVGIDDVAAAAASAAVTSASQMAHRGGEKH